MSTGPSVRASSEDWRREMFESYGRSSTAFLSLSPDLEHLVMPGEGFVAFREWMGVHVVPGDPIASPDGLHDIARTMVERSTMGRQYVLFACDARTKDAFTAQGFRSLHIGSEPVVDLYRFTIAGRRNRGLRGSVNRARRRGLALFHYVPSRGREGSVEKGISNVSTRWCGAKGVPELNFLVGRLDLERTYGKRYVLCLEGDAVIGYILLYSLPGSGDVYLDHMRRLPGTAQGCLDYTLCETIGTLREEGVGSMYMGLCPFSGLEDVREDPAYVRPLFEMLQRPFSLVYPAQGEYKYKRKYATSWEPRFVCYNPRMSVRGLLAILDCFCRGGIPAIMVHKVRRLISGRSGAVP